MVNQLMPVETRAGTSSNFLGIEPFRVVYIKLGLASGGKTCWLEFNELFKFFELYLSPVYTPLSRALSSLMKS